MNLIRNRLTHLDQTLFRALLRKEPIALTRATFLNVGTVFAIICDDNRVRIDATWQPIPINNPWSVCYERR